MREIRTKSDCIQISDFELRAISAKEWRNVRQGRERRRGLSWARLIFTSSPQTFHHSFSLFSVFVLQGFYWSNFDSCLTTLSFFLLSLSISISTRHQFQRNNAKKKEVQTHPPKLSIYSFSPGLEVWKTDFFQSFQWMYSHAVVPDTSWSNVYAKIGTNTFSHFSTPETLESNSFCESVIKVFNIFIQPTRY